MVQSIGQAVHPYHDFAAYLRLADNPDLRFVISNTTEAGIVFNPADKPDDAPADSFPGKLTQFLHRRYMTFDGDINAGLVLLPCEFIENNGDQLKAAILQTARLIGSRHGEAYPIRDDREVLEALRDLWATADVAGGVLTRADWLGLDLNALPGLGDSVRTVVQTYARTGVLPVMP